MLKDGPRGDLTPWSAPAVLLDRVIPPVTITQPHPGIFVVDFGVNVAGVCKLSNINLPAGANVTLKHAEILQHAQLPGVPNPDPTMIYNANLRSAKATDVYISAGTGPATFLPLFTYHGFRFVEVTGVKTLAVADIELHHFHSANPVKSTATFTSKTLTQIQRMAVGAQRSNQMTVLTDCDQRDERLGWMGDANLSGWSIAMNFDVLAFFQSFLSVMADETDADGSGVDVAPNVRYGNRPGDISWTAAFPTVTRVLYHVSNDLATAKTHFAKLMLQLGSVSTQCHGKADGGCPTLYGDWCPPPVKVGAGQGPKPPKPFTSAASFIGETADMLTLSTALGDTTTAAELAASKTKLDASFNAGFFNAGNATYGNGVMSTFSIPLHLGLVPPASLPAVQKGLLDTLQSAANHNYCGIIGMKYLFSALAGMGRKDTALAVLEQVDYPSLGYMAYNTLEPATENLWELPDAPFEGTGMNSRNHHMFSSYSLYLVEEVAGIRQAAGSVGHRDVRFAPAGTLGLRGAQATVETAHGTLAFEWERAGGLQCAKSVGGGPVELSCGTGGGVIAAVQFASHGRPHGVCGALGSTDGCHADLVGTLTARCVGRGNCTAVPPVAVDGCDDATPGDPSWTHVQFVCSAPESITATVTVPIGSTGTIELPTSGVSRPVVTLNGAKARASTTADSIVEVAVGSGTHAVRMSSGDAGPVRVLARTTPTDASTVRLQCAAGAVVTRVTFANHADPASGSAGLELSRCAGGQALVHAVEAACVGQPACEASVPVSACADPVVVDYLCGHAL